MSRRLILVLRLPKLNSFTLKLNSGSLHLAVKEESLLSQDQLFPREETSLNLKSANALTQEMSLL